MTTVREARAIQLAAAAIEAINASKLVLRPAISKGCAPDENASPHIDALVQELERRFLRILP